MKTILQTLILTFIAISAQAADPFAPEAVRTVMDEQEQKIVRYFYEAAEPVSGMALNNAQAMPGVVATGATGFGIMAMVAGVERGWIPREGAARRIVKIVQFLKKAERFRGAWAHWYRPDGTVVPFGNQKRAGEIVETAFLMGGLLTACEYFDGESAAEKELRETTEFFWQTIEWRKFVHDGKLYWIWHADSDTYELPIVGWNETLLVYVLALAAPEPNNVAVSTYHECWQGFAFSHPTRETFGYPLPLGADELGGDLFLSQYSFLGLDPRRMRDDFAFYWRQNLAHTLINRHYCVSEAPVEFRYSETAWGLTACGGCGAQPQYRSRHPHQDDGVLAPTAALAAFPYTPFYSAQVLLNLKKNYPALDGPYGFYVSYFPADGAVSNEYLAMEHAPMAVMMENYRSGLIWGLLMKNVHVQRGLSLAKIDTDPEFPPGFYLAMPDPRTSTLDLLRHPDRGGWELDFYSSNAGQGVLEVVTLTGDRIFTAPQNFTRGPNRISFFVPALIPGTEYRVTVRDGENLTHEIRAIFR